MNKLLKGSIAGAAGVALLLGGAGTFALWNDDASVTGGTITAGNLTVAASAAVGSWESALGGPVVNINAYRIVPGDELTYTKTVTVVAKGDNLVAELALDQASITAAVPLDAQDEALAAYLDNNAVVAATGLTAVVGAATPTYEVPLGTTSVDVTVTITFPAGALDDGSNDAKLGSVNLNDLDVTLNQTF